MLYIAALLFGALLILASDRIASNGLRTRVFVAGEAVMAAVVAAATLGLLSMAVRVIRSDAEEEDR